MKVQAVVPAAGVGERLGSDVTKPFVLLKGVPLIVYALKVLQKSVEIDSVILVGNKDRISELEKICRDHQLTKVARIIVGGETRRESVSNALSAVDEDTEYVLIHDAARPLMTAQIIRDGIRACQKYKAVTAAVPVTSTIKRVDPADQTVVETLDRSSLWEVQTPQIFEKGLIVSAHEESDDAGASDDALLVERMGHKVKIFSGDYRNVKVTTPEDLKIAEAFLNMLEG